MIGQRRDRAWWPLLTSEPIISILFGPHPFEKAICIQKPYKNAWNMPMSQTLLSRSDRPRGKLSVGSFRSYRGGIVARCSARSARSGYQMRTPAGPKRYRQSSFRA